MNRAYPKITRFKMKLTVSFYLFMMISYYFVLYLDTGLINHFAGVTLNHILKALITIPIWWLFFKYLVNQSILQKVIIHLILLPVFCSLWMLIYYPLCNYFGLFYLKGTQQVWDFYLAALFYLIQFGNFHLYNYYVKHKEQELFESELRELTLKSELSALKAQLNPHFLYNIFNTINAAIPSKAERSRNMVAKLSDLFRYQLRASQEELVTVEEELDFVVKYLDLEKERFGARIKYHLNIDEKALQHSIPPIMIQPIVENSIKHGLSSLIDGGEITISIQIGVDQLNFSISDTGVGLRNESPESALLKGIGLSNTNARLMKMYNTNLDLITNAPNGLEVRFSIPITTLR